MSTTPNTSGWTLEAESSNTRYFALEPGVLVGVPAPGSVDDTASARANLAIQLGYFRKTKPGAVIVFFDNLVSQDKGARGVYQTEADPDLMLGTALVGGSLLSRAMGSFFMGLSKPKIPVKMFATLDEALIWAHERIALKEKERRT